MHTANGFHLNQLKGLEQVSQRKPPNLHHFLSELDALYSLASKARLTILPGDTKATDRNWRGMLVGAVALVKHQAGTYDTITGFNTKRTAKPDCSTRQCAEERILEQLVHHHKGRPIESIVGLVVVGDFQVDDTSGVDSITLHPCDNCRSKFDQNPFVQPLTIIVTIRPQHPNTSFNGEIHVTDDLLAKQNKQLTHHQNDFPARDNSSFGRIVFSSCFYFMYRIYTI